MIQYTNGQFYGTAKNEVVKTLLCVMVKSVRGKYRDVVSMTQISNISADKLINVWQNCISVLSEIGFIVVVTMGGGTIIWGRGGGGARESIHPWI